MAIEVSGPNAEQIKYWNEQAGPKWVAQQAFLDDQIRPLGLRAIAAAELSTGERVLDVGCGCGDTTLELARKVGPSGTVTGIDISSPMLAQARKAAQVAGLSNVHFENADAQSASLPTARHDVLYSRFGVMFFENPSKAFTNLRASLKPRARLAFVCWRTLAENPWMFIPVMAAAQHIPMPPPPGPDAPGPGSFADPSRVRRILSEAGFTEVSLAELNQTLTIGGRSDLKQTVEFLLQMGPTGNAIRDAGADAGVLEKIKASVLEALRPYQTPDGVRMGSAAWIVTARSS